MSQQSDSLDLDTPAEPRPTADATAPAPQHLEPAPDAHAALDTQPALDADAPTPTGESPSPADSPSDSNPEGADAAAGQPPRRKRKRKPRQRRPSDASAGMFVAAHDPDKDLRLGTVSAIKDDQVVVDFAHAGKHETGLCPLAEFKKPPRVGEHIEFVVNSTDEDGTLRVERAPLADQIGWRSLNQGDVIDVIVTGMNTGGLEVRMPNTKVRGFLPSSQIEFDKPNELASYLGKTMQVKAIEVDRRKRRLVVSRRTLIEADARIERVAKYAQGQDIAGKVRSITSFGVFVEIEHGIDGLVRLSDLSWVHFDRAEDIVKPGDTVNARIVQIDAKHGKIGLSVKALIPDPWAEVETKYPVGSKHAGTIVRLAEFGAFVALEPGVEGLIHISQLSDRRIEKVEHAAKVGQSVNFMVREVDARRQRLSLSIRALTEPQEQTVGKASRDDIKKYTKRAKDAKAVESLMAKWGDGGGLKGGIG